MTQTPVQIEDDQQRLTPLWQMVSGVNTVAPFFVASSAIPWPMLASAFLLVIVGLSFAARLVRYAEQVRIAVSLLIMLVGIWMLPFPSTGVMGDFFSDLDIAGLLQWVARLLILISATRTLWIVTPRDAAATPLAGLWIVVLGIISAPNAVSPLLHGAVLLYLLSSLALLAHQQCRHWFANGVQIAQSRVLLGVATVLLMQLLLSWLPTMQMQSVNLSTLMREKMASGAVRWALPFMPATGIVLGAETMLTLGPHDWPQRRTPVMRVRIPAAANGNQLWRGQSFDIYDQGAWHASSELTTVATAGWKMEILGERTYLVNIDPLGACFDPGIRQGLLEGRIPLNGTTTLPQLIIPEAAARAGDVPLYGAYQMLEAATDDPALDGVSVRADGAVLVRYQEPTHLPEPYQVTSFSKPSPSIMRLATPVQLPWDEEQRYLQLPGGNAMIPGQHDGVMAKQLRMIADAALGGYANAVDYPRLARVDQLAQYVTLHHRYTLTPLPSSRGVDPMLDFLCRHRQGYCVHFAGALALLCRSQGIPARVVTGFASGEPESVQAGEVTYDVTADDAHAWTEVFLPRYGWYVLDPTLGSQRLPSWWQTSWKTCGSWGASLLAFVRTMPPAAALSVGGVAGVAWLVALAVRWYRRRDLLPELPRQSLSPDEAHQSIVESFHAMLRRCARWGVPKPPGLTAREYVAVLASAHPDLGTLGSELTLLYLRTCYAPDTVGDVEARRAICLLRRMQDFGYREQR